MNYLSILILLFYFTTTFVFAKESNSNEEMVQKLIYKVKHTEGDARRIAMNSLKLFRTTEAKTSRLVPLKLAVWLK